MSKYGGAISTGGGGATISLTKTVAQIDALAPAVDDLAYPTDADEFSARCLVGGTWSWFFRGRPIVRTAVAAWSITANAASAATGFAAADDGASVLLSATGLGGTTGRFRALPAAPYDIRIGILATLSPNAYNGVFLTMRRSSDNRATQLRFSEFDPGGGAGATVRTIDVGTTWAFVATIKTVVEGWMQSDLVYLRIQDNETNRTFSLIRDGSTETIIETRGNTAHTDGATTYNQMGIALGAPGVSSSQISARIVSYEEV